MNKVVLYCRPGFEKECAAEITDKAAKREVFGFARVKENAGYVVFECYQPDDADKLARELPFSSLIFARQMFVAGELLNDRERIGQALVVGVGSFLSFLVGTGIKLVAAVGMLTFVVADTWPALRAWFATVF